MKGKTNTIVIAALEDMVKLHAVDMEGVARELVRLGKRNKRATLLSLLAIGGALYLGREHKKLTDKVDRLEEKQMNLQKDFDNCVIEHAGFVPDKYDEDLDI